MSRLSASPRLRSALFGLLPQARVAIGYLVPFLVLLGILLVDRYPGEGLIGTSRSAVPQRCRPSPVLRAGLAELRTRRAPLLAFAEAGRAPPGFAAAT